MRYPQLKPDKKIGLKVYAKQFARRKQRLAAAGNDPFITDRGLEPKEEKTAAATDAAITDRGLDPEKVDTADVRLASKIAADQKSQGRYVTLIQTVTNRLQFVPNPTTIKEFIEDNKHHPSQHDTTGPHA